VGRRNPVLDWVKIGQNSFIAVRSLRVTSLQFGHMGECTKTGELIEMPFEADSCGSKEPCVRWRSRSDESIHSLEG